MYCNIKSNIIQPPQKLPNKFGLVCGGFNLLSENELNKYGWYKYIHPDSRKYELGELYFDNKTNNVTRHKKEIIKVEKTLKSESIDEICDSCFNKILLKQNLNSNLSYLITIQRKLNLIKKKIQDKPELINNINEIFNNFGLNK